MAHIFIADDDADHLAYVVACVLRLGHQATTFSDGRACLDGIAKGKPDLLLTDIFMPGMDGIELVTALNERGLDVPVIGMTGGFRGVAVPYEHVLQMLGSKCMLRKPFGLQDLKTALCAALQEAA